jgi:hypothetical protein
MHREFGEFVCSHVIQGQHMVCIRFFLCLSHRLEYFRSIIEEANLTAPIYGQISKEMILVTDPARPLPQMSTGSVMRMQAIRLYANEIDELYAALCLYCRKLIF